MESKRLWLTIALGFLGALAHGWALRNFYRLPGLGTPGLDLGVLGIPSISVIIPARNEAENLPALLDDLRRLQPGPCEVIVVDDQSTDGTAAIAAAGGARVMTASPLAGWTGKSYACSVGARAAHGEWLLFTDADTRHAPDSLAAAVAEATRQGVTVFSVMPNQRCVSLWEQLVIPFVFASYFAALIPGRLNRSPREALLNGQYVLVRRDVYWSIGGHEAVAQSLVEDVALAQQFVRAGAPVAIGRANGLVHVRMYRDWGSVAEGFQKNTFAFLTLQPLRGFCVAATTVGAALAGPACLLAGRGNWAQRVAASAALAVAVGSFGRWVHACGGAGWLAPLQPVAATVSLWIVLRSAASVVLRRPVTWKGRAYQAR